VPARDRLGADRFTALRYDVAFAVGVLTDALRDRPFTS